MNTQETQWTLRSERKPPQRGPNEWERDDAAFSAWYDREGAYDAVGHAWHAGIAYARAKERAVKTSRAGYISKT